MEEQDIREIWKSDDSAGDFNYSGKTIERILSQGPQNIVAKFVRTLKIEQHINWIAFTLLMAFFLYERFWFWSAAILALNVGFFFYYKRLIRRLDREYVDNEVIQYLHEVHRIILRFIRHYQIATLLVAVPGYLLGILLVEGFFSDTKPPADLLWGVGYVHLIGISVAIGAALLLIYLIYGRKAAKIREMINSLDSAEA